MKIFIVSVPIRGLFNLTLCKLKENTPHIYKLSFRPHQGII